MTFFFSSSRSTYYLRRAILFRSPLRCAFSFVSRERQPRTHTCKGSISWIRASFIHSTTRQQSLSSCVTAPLTQSAPFVTATNRVRASGAARRLFGRRIGSRLRTALCKTRVIWMSVYLVTSRWERLEFHRIAPVEEHHRFTWKIVGEKRVEM